MWVWSAANGAVAKYRATPEYLADNGRSYQSKMKPTARVKAIENIVAYCARLAFSRGLTTAAAAQIGEEAARAARASFGVNGKDGKAAREQARLHAEAAIGTAQEKGLGNPPMADGALLTRQMWVAFCAQADVDCKHREMQDAIASALQEFAAEFGP